MQWIERRRGLPLSGRFDATINEAYETLVRGETVWWVTDTLRRVERVEQALLARSHGALTGVEVLSAGGFPAFLLSHLPRPVVPVDNDVARLLMRETLAKQFQRHELDLEMVDGWLEGALGLHRRMREGESLQTRLQARYPWLNEALRDYRQLLERSGRTDLTSLAGDLARKLPEEFRGPDLFVIDRMGPVPVSTMELLEAVAARSRHGIVLLDASRGLGPALALARRDESRWVDPGDGPLEDFPAKPYSLYLARTLSHPKPELRTDASLPSVIYGGFTGETDEVHAVAREIARLTRVQSVPVEDIAVVCTSLGHYAPVIESLFARFGIPTDLRLGTPLYQNPVARLASQLLDARVQHLPRERFTELLLNPYVNGGKGLETDREVLQFDTEARTARIIGGEQPWESRWIEPLQELAGRLQKRLDTLHADERDEGESEETVARTQALRDRRDGLQQALPTFEKTARWIMSLPDPCGIDDVEQWLEEGFRRLGVYRAMRKHQQTPGTKIHPRTAYGRVRILLRNVRDVFEMVGLESWPLHRYADLLGYALRQDRIPARLKSQGGVPVTGPLELRGLRIRYLFFLGWSAEHWPRRPEPDPLEPDSAGWAGDIDRLAESRALTYEALLAAGTLYLSAPTAGGDESSAAPSPLLLDLDRIGLKRIEWPASEGWFALRDVQTGSVRSLADGVSLDHVAPVLQTAAAKVHETSAWQPVRQWPLRVGVEMHRADASTLTVFEGYLRNPRVQEEIAARVERFPYSVKRLETYAACPMKFFLEQVLHVEPLEEVEDDLDAAGRGELVHRIAEETARRLRGPDQFSVPFSDTVRPRRVMQDAARDLIAEYPFDNLFWDETVRQVTSGLEDDNEPAGYLRTMLDYEQEKKMRDERIRMVEASFGFGPDVDSDLLFAEPYIVEADGRSVPLRGRIDRIGLNANKGWRIWDYKVSNTSLPTKSHVLNGVAFQLPVYMLLLERALETGVLEGASTIDQAAFYQLKRTDDLVKASNSGKWAADQHASYKETLKRNIVSIVKAVQAGRFHHPLSQNDKLCRESREHNYCPFFDICRRDPVVFKGRTQQLPADSLDRVYKVVGQTFRHDPGDGRVTDG
ncbi:hypothetical protein GF324_11430 [bacterium]|nr:hypothetical protein [bacterium]